MKFIVDENLPRRAAAWLAAHGHEAWHVSDIGLLGQADPVIWAEAVARGAFVVTRDNDFAALAKATTEGCVVRLEIGNCPTPVLRARLEALWSEIESRLARGERLIEIG
jgi:predicted nuclease of predicted toxin-antitoxin system